MASDMIVNVLSYSSLCEVSADAGKVATATPIVQLVLGLISAATHGVSLWGNYNVWFHFEKDGFSDNPLIPPKTSWMVGWLALTVLRTLLAFGELLIGLLGFANATYMCCRRDRVSSFYAELGKSYKLRHCLLWAEETMGAVGVLVDLVLLLLGYFYYIVQSDCQDLNDIDEVIITIALTTVGLLWQVVRFVIIVVRHFGCFCCKAKETYDDLIPVLVTNLACLKIILQPILLVSGIVLLGLTVKLQQETDSFDRSSIHIIRNNSDNYTMLFSITDMPMNGTGNLTILEEHPGPDNTDMIHCVATFHYDPDSREFIYSVAYVENTTSIPAQPHLCTCIHNHEMCRVHYDNLYYGHSSNGKPYACYNRASLVGIYRENSPTHDEDGKVYCVCPELKV